MRILSADEIRKVECKCFELYSSEAELMLRAGLSCFNEIIRKYEASMRGKTVAVFCGNGKNAGDGFVIARFLWSRGIDAKIVLCDKVPSIEEPLMYFEQAKRSRVKVESFTEESANADFIIDCIFGIGFHGEARAPFDKVFEAVNNSGATVISIDTPSGTDATTGAACKNAIKADFTIAISTLKYAHVLPPSNALCGEIVCVDIGISDDCYEEGYPETIEFEDVKKCFDKRDKNSNKGSFGHQLNICSSYKMFGAGVIATQSGIKSGAGLVKLMLPKSAYNLCAKSIPQALFEPAEENEEKTFSKEAINGIDKQLEWADSVVLGCGIGVNEDTKELCEYVLKNSKAPIILDADGINCINGRISILKEIKAPIVLTPHPLEMARLVSKSIAEIQENRIKTAKAFAKETNAVLVLKGANTVVSDGERVFVNLTGNPSMAMGGTGDMLSGMLAAFIAQGMSAFDAAKCAVYIHGLSGDIASQKISQRGILVFDMIEQLGALMSRFE